MGYYNPFEGLDPTCKLSPEHKASLRKVHRMLILKINSMHVEALAEAKQIYIYSRKIIYLLAYSFLLGHKFKMLDETSDWFMC